MLILRLPTCLVSTLCFFGGIAVSTTTMGEAAKPFLSKASKQVLMSFCVAGVAGRDILTYLQMVSRAVLCDRCNTFARFSGDDFHVSWHVQHFGRVHVHFCVAGAAL